MDSEKFRAAGEVADRLRGKKIIRRIDVGHSASEAAERVNQVLELKIENPDDFAELRDSIERIVLEYLASRSDFSVVNG